jgi:hypothetical protein
MADPGARSGIKSKKHNVLSFLHELDMRSQAFILEVDHPNHAAYSLAPHRLNPNDAAPTMRKPIFLFDTRGIQQLRPIFEKGVIAHNPYGLFPGLFYFEIKRQPDAWSWGIS